MSADGDIRVGAPVVLLWSARYDVENGQAIVTRRVVERQTRVRWIKAIYEPGDGLAAILAAASALRAVWLALWFRPETIYAVCARSTLGFCRDLPVLLTALLGYRVVAHIHGSDLPKLLQKPFWGFFARAIYRRCEIVVPSAHLVPNLRALGCTKVTVCENFRWDTYAPITPPTYEGGIIRLLWNSNIMASKGIRECVAGAQLARSSGMKLRLTVLGRAIGDAEASEAEMVEFAKSLSAEEWIEVVGLVSADRAQAMVEGHHAIMLPSRYSSECQPLAIIDSMAAAREILISDTPALRTTAGNYPAIVVNGDVLSIAAAILSLPANSAARAEVLKDGAITARERFSPERFDQDMQTILTSGSLSENNLAKIETQHS